MIFDEEARKKYSSGSLLKKKKCGGRTIRVESLDVQTAERINRRVSATAKQHIIESHVNSHADEQVFRAPVKTLRLKIK